MIMSHPILVVPAIPIENGGIRFLHLKEQIEISSAISSDIWRIIQYCTGFNDVATIIDKSGLKKEYVNSVLKDLELLEIIVDSDCQYKHFHRISSFPSPFYPSLTQKQVYNLGLEKRNIKSGKAIFLEKVSSSDFELLSSRRSCRNFSEEPLCSEFISEICQFAYSIHDHVVPSGGGLYPVRLFLLIEKNQIGLKKGYYEYDPEKNSLICFNHSPDSEQIKYCFSDTRLPFNSSIQIFLAVDLSRQSIKYGNRAYRLALLEAGHVAQNINIYCTKKGLGACELGGVLDEPILRELDIENDEVFPVLAIAIGKPTSDIQRINELSFVEDNLKQPYGPISDIAVTTFDNGAFFAASARFGESENDVSGATSSSSANAIFKAAIEGYERYCSIQSRIDWYGSAKDLKSEYLSPKELFPLTDKQISKAGLISYSDDTRIGWTLGERFSDNCKIYIPSDYIFYPDNDSPKLYFGHSSGVAAFTNIREAQKRGLTELIERDALMRSWFYHTSPQIISDDLLPVHARKRKAYYESIGKQVYFQVLNSDYALVTQVIIVGDSYPFFKCGAAASIDGEFESSLYKALQEAEYSYQLDARINPENPFIVNANDVHSPLDHGKFYQSAERIKSLDWLSNGSIIDEIPNFTLSFDELMRNLDAVSVDLSENEHPIKVVRVISPKLVPISFGANLAHFSHKSLNQGLIHPDALIYPHYFS